VKQKSMWDGVDVGVETCKILFTGGTSYSPVQSLLL